MLQLRLPNKVKFQNPRTRGFCYNESVRNTKKFLTSSNIVSIFLLIVLAALVYLNIEVIVHKNKSNSSLVNTKTTLGDKVTNLNSEYKKEEFSKSVVTKQPSKDALYVPILMYHHVGSLPENADSLRKDLTVSSENFEEQVKWLKSQGYESVSLDDIYSASQKKFVLPKKSICFTFDDGYADVFANAVPILEKYGYTGSFAIITQFVGTPDYADWSDIKKAHNEGMEIVSHTQNHFDGSSAKYNSEFIYKNLEGSRSDLLQNLGSSSRILVYPYGHYTGVYIEEAKKSGFVMALTVKYGKYVEPSELFEVPRVRVHGAEVLAKFQENLSK